jgi:hypothetical protein
LGEELGAGVRDQGSGVRDLVFGWRRRSKDSFFFVLLFVDVFGVEFFAGIALGAVEASVGGIADAVLGRQLVAVLGLRDRLDCVVGEYFEFSIDVLRGNLKAIEEETGAAGIEFRGAERAENPEEGYLDGTAIFEDGKLKRGIFAGYRFLCAVEAVVKVAIGHALEGWGLAPAAVGFDVSAFEVHGSFLPIPPYGFCK